MPPTWGRSSRRRRRRGTRRPRVGGDWPRRVSPSRTSGEDFEVGPGGHYLIRDGALIAWRVPDERRTAYAVPDRRIAHRLARIPAQAAAGSRRVRLAAARRRGLRRAAAQLLAGPRAGPGRSAGAGLGRGPVGPHRGDHADPAARDPSRSRGQRRGPEAGQAAAHRAGLERRPAGTADPLLRRGAGRLSTARRSTATTWSPTTPPRRRSSVRTVSSSPQAGWTT